MHLSSDRELDARFAQWDFSWVEADRVVDEDRELSARLAPREEQRRTARRVERRFLQVQPALDGSGGSGFFGSTTGESFALITQALEAAMPRPSAGPCDVTRHATRA